MPALVARRAFADSLEARGKSKMSALLTVEHKLLRHAFALPTHQFAYDPNHPPLKPLWLSFLPRSQQDGIYCAEAPLPSVRSLVKDGIRSQKVTPPFLILGNDSDVRCHPFKGSG